MNESGNVNSVPCGAPCQKVEWKIAGSSARSSVLFGVRKGTARYCRLDSASVPMHVCAWGGYSKGHPSQHRRLRLRRRWKQ